MKGVMSAVMVLLLLMFVDDLMCSPLSLITTFSSDEVLSLEQFQSFFYFVFPNLNTTHAIHDHQDFHEEDSDVHCENATEIFTEFDEDESGFLDEFEMDGVVYEMMIMLIDGCNEDTVHGIACEESSVAMAWVYGLIASVVISLFSLCGVILLPLKGEAKDKLMQALIGLSVGALIGDAIIHIFPQILGAHSHQSETHVEESYISESLSYILPCTLSVLSILLFYFIEVLLDHCTGGYHSIATDTTIISLGRDEVPSESSEKSESQIQSEIQSVGYMIIFVDAIHNFVDGLALGTAFITSPIVGIATAVAITLHEIPQELGDFAVLLWAGFSRKQALGYNLLSSLTAVIGTGIGLALGDIALAADKWILSVVAGSFLYIALGELLPHLRETRKKHRIPVAEMVLMLVGVCLMVGLSFVELALEVECI